MSTQPSRRPRFAVAMIAAIIAFGSFAGRPQLARASSQVAPWSGLISLQRVTTGLTGEGDLEDIENVDAAYAGGYATVTVDWTIKSTWDTFGQLADGTPVHCSGTKTASLTGSTLNVGPLGIVFIPQANGDYQYGASMPAGKITHEEDLYTSVFAAPGGCQKLTVESDVNLGETTAECACGIAAHTFGVLVGTDSSSSQPPTFFETLTWSLTSADSDQDGLIDAREIAIDGTDPANPDTDGDGLTDGYEVFTPYDISPYYTNATTSDTDGDGLSDGAEVNTYHTNPLLADTDGDGFSDADEIAAGSDPNDASSIPGAPPDPCRDGTFHTVQVTSVGSLPGVLQNLDLFAADTEILYCADGRTTSVRDASIGSRFVGAPVLDTSPADDFMWALAYFGFEARTSSQAPKVTSGTAGGGDSAVESSVRFDVCADLFALAQNLLPTSISLAWGRMKPAAREEAILRFLGVTERQLTLEFDEVLNEPLIKSAPELGTLLENLEETYISLVEELHKSVKELAALPFTSFLRQIHQDLTTCGAVWIPIVATVIAPDGSVTAAFEDGTYLGPPLVQRIDSVSIDNH